MIDICGTVHIVLWFSYGLTLYNTTRSFLRNLTELFEFLKINTRVPLSDAMALTVIVTQPNEIVITHSHQPSKFLVWYQKNVQLFEALNVYGGIYITCI